MMRMYSDEEKKAIDYLKLVAKERTIIPLCDKITILLNLIEKQDKIINEIKNKLEKHIQYCEQEARGSLNNKICHISLKFDKSLLDIINKGE